MERAIAPAQQHRDVSGVPVAYGQVEVAIAVNVRRHDGKNQIVAHDILLGGLEGAIAVAQ